MRSRAIDVNARAAESHTSPTDGRERRRTDRAAIAEAAESGSDNSGGHVGAGDDDGSVAVSVEGGNSRGG